jgi:thiamine kinase-like enzyme
VPQLGSGRFERLFETLREVGARAAPAWLPAAPVASASRWRAIEREADSFLALRLCTESWFREAIDGLIDAEEGHSLEGDSLVHNDVRSDNLYFAGDRVTLVD